MAEWYENCFAYPEIKMNDNGCKALNTMDCKNKGKCKFYKSKEQYNKDKEIYDFINSIRRKEK